MNWTSKCSIRCWRALHFPIVLPPVMIDGFQLTDGGVTAVVPIEVALLRGATELYVIDLEPDVSKTQPIHGVLPIAAANAGRPRCANS